MASSVSRNTLKISLVCLLGFTAFCLVVLEVTLNDQRLEASHQRYSASKGLQRDYPIRQRGMPSMASSASRSVLSPETQQNLSHSPASSQNVGTDLKVSVGEVFRIIAGTSVRNLIDNSSFHDAPASFFTTTPFSNAQQNKKKLSTQRVPSVESSVLLGSFLGAVPPPSIMDHCKLARQGPTATSNQTFTFKSQSLPNGTRPVSCNGCFNANFPGLIENCGVCNTGMGNRSQKVEMVIVILTTHGAVDRRQAIRDTWASVTRNNTAHIRHVFLLGRVKDERSMKSAHEEQARHGDIIMYDFMDSYSNLTLKTLTAMRWATRFCGNARFLLKADDDMWINVPNLLNIARRENATLHTAVGGACRFNEQPIRSKNSKWYASVKAYPEKTYPGFCSGTTYVTSLNVARHVISVSPHVPFFYLEDVYVSLCIQRLGPPFKLKGLRGFFHGWSNPCKLRAEETVTVHQVSPAKLKEIWKAQCPSVTQ
ncbi:beta-1,3-galactosyltransferase 5-like [Littorina saxatilis]|uniref:Hexosyltransferase n=1 Tax=Littorina saxatilis TaxID=31220 RepID=A0AAN9G1L2_9CAEN